MYWLSAGVVGYLTTTPENVAVASGTRVTLHCTSSYGSGAIRWYQLYNLIVYNCVSWTPYFTTTTSIYDGRCDLNILNTTSSTVGRFRCYEYYNGAYYSSSYSYVTVTSTICVPVLTPI